MIHTKSKLKRIAEIRGDFENMSDSLRDEVYVILQSSKNRTVCAAAIQALYLAQLEIAGAPIISYSKMHEALDNKYKDGSTYLYILDIFHVVEEGIIVTGYVIGENINPNDDLLLEKADGRDMKMTCIDISEYPSKVAFINLSGIALSELSQGDRIVKL